MIRENAENHLLYFCKVQIRICFVASREVGKNSKILFVKLIFLQLVEIQKELVMGLVSRELIGVEPLTRFEI